MWESPCLIMHYAIYVGVPMINYALRHFIILHKIVSCLRQSHGISLLRSECNPRILLVGFMVRKMALGQIFV
jgi:hypothetical protein